MEKYWLNNAFGSLVGLPKKSSQANILDKVQKGLKQFSKEQKQSKTIKNENGLTQELVKLLNETHHFAPYYFHSEYMENSRRGNSPRSDVSIISTQKIRFSVETVQERERIFLFEAKRLGKFSRSREKEYLIGRDEKGKFINSGGVERFKNGTHGQELSEAGIIGYLQNEDFQYWETSINNWIDELILQSPLRNVEWKEQDKLKQTSTHIADTVRFTSINSRKQDSIILHHIWVDLT